jgi:hypothetical protein
VTTLRTALLELSLLAVLKPAPLAKKVLFLRKGRQAAFLATSTWTTMRMMRNVPAEFPSSPMPTENAHVKQVTR